MLFIRNYSKIFCQGTLIEKGSSISTKGNAMKKKPYEQKMYKEKKKKNKIRMRFDFNRKGVIFFAVAAFIICAVSIIGTDMGWIDQGGVVSSLKRNSADAPVTYGKVLSQDETTENGKQVCTLKVKIQAKRTKDQTVEQNYYNIIQFVKNNPDKYDVIHYEGVAENSGRRSKSRYV